MGLIVHICGPTFAGKSYLISKLVYDFESFKVILFEKHNNVPGKMIDKYKSFYSDIEQTSIEHNIFAESIYSSKNKILNYKFDKLLNIVCFPSFKDHQTNLNRYIERFGKDELFKSRTCNFNISLLRNNFMSGGYPTANKVIYNLNNYDKIKGEIEKWI